MLRKFMLFIASLLIATMCSGADHDEQMLRNWPQWRGPLATGVAPHGDPPIRWSETENVKWKVPVAGEGHATPIVWEDQVFVLSAVKTARRVDKLEPPRMEPPGGYKTQRPKNYYRFMVQAFDRADGALRWQQVACEALPHEGRHDTNSYASGSPATDGERLYVSFGSQGLYCYDLRGELLWKRDLGDMVTRLGWGEGVSPVVYQDNVIVNWDHEGASFLAVLDPQSGDIKWKKQRDEVTSWVTPRVIEHRGVTQVIVPATGRVISYDLASGDILWHCDGLTTNVIPSPVVYDDLVICMSGHRGTEAVAVRLDSRGDLTNQARQIAWRIERDTPYVPSPLLYGDLLYFTKSNMAIMTCVDPGTGRVLSKAERLPQLQNIYASPVGAAGRIYFTSREGVTLVARHQAELDVLAVNQLAEGIDASPAIVGHDLILRSAKHLYCLAEE